MQQSLGKRERERDIRFLCYSERRILRDDFEVVDEEDDEVMEISPIPYRFNDASESDWSYCWKKSKLFSIEISIKTYIIVIFWVSQHWLCFRHFSFFFPIQKKRKNTTSSSSQVSKRQRDFLRWFCFFSNETCLIDKQLKTRYKKKNVIYNYLYKENKKQKAISVEVLSFWISKIEEKTFDGNKVEISTLVFWYSK